MTYYIDDVVVYGEEGRSEKFEIIGFGNGYTESRSIHEAISMAKEKLGSDSRLTGHILSHQELDKEAWKIKTGVDPNIP